MWGRYWILHRDAFRVVHEADETLRFVAADGRTIPRGGYRHEDFVDDDIGGQDASRDGFRMLRKQEAREE